MPKEHLHIKYVKKPAERGFSLVEVILSSAVFVLLVTALLGAYLYGQESTALAGARARANMLAVEGLEAARNIRDAGFNDLAVGDHGLTISSNQWAFLGTEDVSDIFTRKITIANIDSDRKTITSTVTWQQNQSRTATVELVTRFTNWLQTVSNWANPAVQSTLDLSGTENGIKIQSQGNYVYIVRSGGTPDFAIVDVTTPASPTLVGSLSLADTPTNIFVSGNYAYVSSQSNGEELQIIDISTPSAPSVLGTYDAAGNQNASGVFVVGTTVYLVRASGNSDEFLVIDASTPSSPSLVGTLNLGGSGYEVWASGTKAYVASGVNSAELQVVDISTPALPSIVGTYDVSGNTDALTIAGVGSTVFLGSAANIHLLDVSTPTSPTLISTFAGAGTVNDIALNLGNSASYVYFCTESSNKEFELFDISVPATPVSVGGLNLATFYGIAYDETLDRAFLVGPTDAEELTIIMPQ